MDLKQIDEHVSEIKQLADRLKLLERSEIRSYETYWNLDAIALHKEEGSALLENLLKRILNEIGSQA